MNLGCALAWQRPAWFQRDLVVDTRCLRAGCGVRSCACFVGQEDR